MIDAKIGISELDETLQVAYDLSNECEARFSEKGVCIPIVHSSLSAFAKIDLQPVAFDEYDCEEQTIGLSLKKLKKIVSNSSSDSKLSIQLEEDDHRLFLESDMQQYEIALIDLENIQSPPNIEDNYSTEIQVSQKDLERSVTAADMFSEDITFSYDSEGNTFLMEAEGDTDITRKILDENDLVNAEGDSAEVVFGLSFLTQLCNSIPSDSVVTMKLKQDRPGLFEYDVIEGAGSVQYVLAPRIDSS